MTAYLATKALEYACYAVIFGGIAVFWIMTPTGMN